MISLLNLKKWAICTPLNRPPFLMIIASPMIAATPCDNASAIAAPIRPNSGNPKRPFTRTRPNTTFSTFIIPLMSIGVTASPLPCNPPDIIRITPRKGIPKPTTLSTSAPTESSSPFAPKMVSHILGTNNIVDKNRIEITKIEPIVCLSAFFIRSSLPAPYACATTTCTPMAMPLYSAQMIPLTLVLSPIAPMAINPRLPISFMDTIPTNISSILDTKIGKINLKMDFLISVFESNVIFIILPQTIYFDSLYSLAEMRIQSSMNTKKHR